MGWRRLWIFVEPGAGRWNRMDGCGAGKGRLGKQDLDYPLRGKISVHVYTVCLSLSIYLSIFLSYLSIDLSILSIHPSSYLAICLSIYIYIWIYIKIHIYIYAYIFLSPTVTIEFAAHICIYICMCVTLCFMVYGQI
jgi:hypothetical protein